MLLSARKAAVAGLLLSGAPDSSAAMAGAPLRPPAHAPASSRGHRYGVSAPAQAWPSVPGLGLVTPLGAGVQASWDQLIAFKTGVQALSAESLRLKDAGLLQQLPSRVAALVPRGSAPGDFDVEKWQKPAEPGFIAYAQCAAEEALTDANWHPQEYSGDG